VQYRFQSNGRIYTVSIERLATGHQAVMDGIYYPFEVLDEKPGQISLLFNGHPAIIYWAVDAGQKWISLEGCTYLLENPSSRTASRPGEAAGEDILRAPMPAQVRLISAATGDWLEKGETLMTLEAMKMEIRLVVPRTGRLVRLLVGVGQSVDRNQVLAEMRQEAL
jgi:acetyl/propionyl-CoA carboxylase alpha subunit